MLIVKAVGPPLAKIPGLLISTLLLAPIVVALNACIGGTGSSGGGTSSEPEEP